MARHRGEQEDPSPPALRAHLAGRRLGQEVGAPEVHRHQPVERVGLVGEEIAVEGEAGVGHRQVEPSERLDRLLHQAPDHRDLGPVAPRGPAHSAFRGDPPRRRLGPPRVDVVEEDAGTLEGQPARDLLADARARPRDHRDPAREGGHQNTLNFRYFLGWLRMSAVRRVSSSAALLRLAAASAALT